MYDVKGNILGYVPLGEAMPSFHSTGYHPEEVFLQMAARIGLAVVNLRYMLLGLAMNNPQYS